MRVEPTIEYPPHVVSEEDRGTYKAAFLAAYDVALRTKELESQIAQAERLESLQRSSTNNTTDTSCSGLTRSSSSNNNLTPLPLGRVHSIPPPPNLTQHHHVQPQPQEFPPHLPEPPQPRFPPPHHHSSRQHGHQQQEQFMHQREYNQGGDMRAMAHHYQKQAFALQKAAADAIEQANAFDVAAAEQKAVYEKAYQIHMLEQQKEKEREHRAAWLFFKKNCLDGANEEKEEDLESDFFADVSPPRSRRQSEQSPKKEEDKKLEFRFLLNSVETARIEKGKLINNNKQGSPASSQDSVCTTAASTHDQTLLSTKAMGRTDVDREDASLAQELLRSQSDRNMEIDHYFELEESDRFFHTPRATEEFDTCYTSTTGFAIPALTRSGSYESSVVFTEDELQGASMKHRSKDLTFGEMMPPCYRSYSAQHKQYTRPFNPPPPPNLAPPPHLGKEVFEQTVTRMEETNNKENGEGEVPELMDNIEDPRPITKQKAMRNLEKSRDELLVARNGLIVELRTAPAGPNRSTKMKVMRTIHNALATVQRSISTTQEEHMYSRSAKRNLDRNDSWDHKSYASYQNVKDEEDNMDDEKMFAHGGVLFRTRSDPNDYQRAHLPRVTGENHLERCDEDGEEDFDENLSNDCSDLRRGDLLRRALTVDPVIREADEFDEDSDNEGGVAKLPIDEKDAEDGEEGDAERSNWYGRTRTNLPYWKRYGGSQSYWKSQGWTPRYGSSWSKDNSWNNSWASSKPKYWFSHERSGSSDPWSSFPHQSSTRPY